MDLVLDMLRWLALLPGAAVAAYWAVFVYRVVRARMTVPGVSEGLRTAAAESGDLPRVSVIVPAHNEEAVIADCARRLAEQDYPNLECVFALDRCTDMTRARLEAFVAGDPRFIIVEVGECPPDWAGKCNAAHHGAKHASGEWLLFTDADTGFDSRLVRAAVGLARGRGLDLLSLLSTLSYKTWFERVVQPVASFNLIRMYPVNRVNRPGSGRSFANGQFMLFSRSKYEEIGGHVAVRSDLLEDIAFARAVRRAGGRLGVFFDDRMLHVRMYDSFGAFREGWKRIFIEACKRYPRRLRKNALRVAFIAVGAPSILLGTVGYAAILAWSGFTLIGTAGIVIAAAGFAFRVFGVASACRLAGAPLASSIVYEVGSWHVASILRDAARDLETGRPVRWGGREYVLAPGSRR